MLSSKSLQKFKDVTPPSVVALAIRKCYATEDKSDNGGPKDLSLIKRIGVTLKHSSVLRHGVFSIYIPEIKSSMVSHLLRNHEFTEVIGDTIVTNVQVILELGITLDTKKQLLPEQWHYLL